jgi:hypothetical protein
MTLPTSTQRAIWRFVDSLPPDGRWWRDEGRDVFIAAMVRLMDLGLPFVEAKALCKSLYDATANEYGQ